MIIKVYFFFLYNILFLSHCLGQEEVEIIEIDTIEEQEDTTYIIGFPIYFYPIIKIKDRIINIPDIYKHKKITGKVSVDFTINKKGEINDYILSEIFLKDSMDNYIIYYYNNKHINKYSDTLVVFYDLILEKKKDILIEIDSNFINCIKDNKLNCNFIFIFKDD